MKTEERVNGPSKFDPRVDLSQLRERLKLTPAERFRIAVESANNLRDFLDRVRLRK
jgi:hypothetical protein